MTVRHHHRVIAWPQQAGKRNEKKRGNLTLKKQIASQPSP